MKDNYGRQISYLRLSVTDLCNLRCQYCMPAGGVEKRSHRDILSFEALEAIVRAAVKCGVRKVRVTGGEPLVRRNIPELCRRIAAIEGVEELCMTTNGILLPKYAQKLRDSGVQRLNISLDTLRPDRYAALTRTGCLDDALAGMEAARAAGFETLKINAVLIGGVNDDEIADLAALTRDKPDEVRFIELMPMGECARWDKSRFLSCSAVLEALPGLEEIAPSGVARRYRMPGWKGTIGLIRPVSAHFCPACDRIRVTADGRLKPCLHSALEVPLAGLEGKALERAVAGAILAKPHRHHLEQGSSQTPRSMNEIGG